MGNDSFATKTGEVVTAEEIKLIVADLITEIIIKNKPYSWIATKEPFYNIYKNQVSYDYSGTVIKMTKNDLDDLVRSIQEDLKPCFSSPLDELLSSVYIDEWEPSYTSNYGKNWMDYRDLLSSEYSRWMYDNFIFYDEGSNEITEGSDEITEGSEALEMELEEILIEFIKVSSWDIYLAKLYRSLQASPA